MDNRKWAKTAWEWTGYSTAEISEVCGITQSTVRTWRRKDKWGDQPRRVSKKVRLEIETAIDEIDITKRNFPQPAQAGDQKALSHGLRTKAFEYFSGNAKAVIREVLDNPDPDELENLQTAAAVSLAFISDWAEAIRQLEIKAQEVAVASDIENEGVLNHS